jgi:putative phage-type endonuclease
MQIYDDVQQHLENGEANPEWLMLRAGKFTGSDFNQYMSLVNKGELSDTAESNLYKKVLESMGYLFDSVRSSAMEQGNELEPYARREYIEETFNDVKEVAFVDWEQMRAGCSPDGVIYHEEPIVDDIYYQKDKNGELQILFGKPKEYIMRDLNKIDKIIEIKCPEIKNYLKMAKGKIPKQYECQMQFNMLITGAKSCDFVVYHPDMKLSIQTILPDEKWQADIKNALEKLNAKYNEILKEIKELKK